MFTNNELMIIRFLIEYTLINDHCNYSNSQINNIAEQTTYELKQIIEKIDNYVIEEYVVKGEES